MFTVAQLKAMDLNQLFEVVERELKRTDSKLNRNWKHLLTELHSAKERGIWVYPKIRFVVYQVTEHDNVTAERYAHGFYDPFFDYESLACWFKRRAGKRKSCP